jgi:hypothetical protein
MSFNALGITLERVGKVVGTFMTSCTRATEEETMGVFRWTGWHSLPMLTMVPPR